MGYFNFNNIDVSFHVGNCIPLLRLKKVKKEKGGIYNPIQFEVSLHKMQKTTIKAFSCPLFLISVSDKTKYLKCC